MEIRVVWTTNGSRCCSVRSRVDITNRAQRGSDLTGGAAWSRSAERGAQDRIAQFRVLRHSRRSAAPLCSAALQRHVLLLRRDAEGSLGTAEPLCSRPLFVSGCPSAA
ncbi:hypothetical protein EYF80_065501 [Liparis tanakae]|uniref:Uncharacterized protein n=1 Tax=Liparis tanakae TaxID=230148 RepID=A0A4Z2E722_9TELE|nr:hypothetical protein EYF80_065501 [Liparis tanakae]